MLKLYGVPPTRAIRPIWLLNELGLDCEIVAGDPLDPAFAAEVEGLNPSGKVPILVDGDFVVSESVAICCHLAENHDGGRFIPTDPAQRSMMHQWLFYLVTDIEQPLWRIARHDFIYKEADRRPEERPRAEKDLARDLVKLEAHLEGREFIVGDTVTLVDFIAAYTLDWVAEENLINESPNCRRFVENMYARGVAPVRIAEGSACMKAGEVAPRYRRDLSPERRIDTPR